MDQRFGPSEANPAAADSPFMERVFNNLISYLTKMVGCQVSDFGLLNNGVNFAR
jgi:hypothetical protein